MKRLRARTRNRKGQTLVEFAAVIPFVLILLFGIVEFGIFFHTKITVRHSVLEAARFAVTGSPLMGADGEALPRSESITSVILARSNNVRIDLDGIEIDPPDGGGPQDIVRVSVTYRYIFSLPLLHRFIPDDAVVFTISTTMRNEPFPN